MQRIPEPELMDGEEQARAYAEADFSEANTLFMSLFEHAFPDAGVAGPVVDLGCGPGDICLRFAAARPGCHVDAVDGAEAMLAHGRAAAARSPAGDRVRFVQALLPHARLPEPAYLTVISNSLLHHLEDPQALWRTVRRCAAPGAPVLVMDLFRPEDEATLQSLVEQYAADAPAVLRHDFSCSLRAAYRVPEVQAQLQEAGLADLRVEQVSDRHLAAWGRAPSS